MSCSDELKARIRRLYFAEHWKVGTICSQLGLHPDQVKGVLGLEPESQTPKVHRPCLLDPFESFIEQTLTSYPRLCATRLYDMLRERGFTGSVRTVRDHVQLVRPEPHKEAFLRIDPLCGEQAQIDWAHVGQIAVPGGVRALWAFVMVLSYSRALWAELVLDLTVHSLCRSLVRATSFFGGTTRQWLFDNPKIVVLERQGALVRFHPTLLSLCSQMHVEPRLCAVARPEHKGRVERSIRYLRDRFLAGRHIASVEEGNRQLLTFIHEIAHARPHPRLAGQTVGQVFDQERPRLLALPKTLPQTDLVLPVAVDKTAFVRLETNLYSVPHGYARKTLTLVADDRVVRLLDGQQCVAEHARCFGRKQVLEDPAHRKALLEQRQAARDLKGRDLLRSQVPQIDALLGLWLQDGRNLGSLVARTTKLLDLYGKDILQQAVAQVLEREQSDLGALAACCEHLRKQQQRPLPVEVNLSPDVPDRDVIPHDLERYDAKPKR